MLPASRATPRGILTALLLVALNAGAEPGAGDVAPDYVGRLADGTDVTISDHAGKAIVLSFWATWCPYCLQELPILNASQVSPARNSIQVIAVNTEERDVFQAAFRALGSSQALKLAYDPTSSAQHACGVKGISHMDIIGKDGNIIRVYRGYDAASLPRMIADINQASGATDKAGVE